MYLAQTEPLEVIFCFVFVLFFKLIKFVKQSCELYNFVLVTETINKWVFSKQTCSGGLCAELVWIYLSNLLMYIYSDKYTRQLCSYNQSLFFLIQERLLLSILPKHIADEMLQDMKKEASQKEMQQFNTMYMYRHENVRWVCYSVSVNEGKAWCRLFLKWAFYCISVAVFCSQTSWASHSCPRPVVHRNWLSC